MILKNAHGEVHMLIHPVAFCFYVTTELILFKEC